MDKMADAGVASGGPETRERQFWLELLPLMKWLGAWVESLPATYAQGVLGAIRDTVARTAPGQRPQELPSTNQQGARPPYYYVDVTVPCPFLLRVQRGYQIAPLWGSGADEWYLWIFGFKFIIARPMVWVS